MAKKKTTSKTDIKKINKVYKIARERVHHCDFKRIDPACFCAEDDPEYTGICEALANNDRGKLAEIFLSMNQKKKEMLFRGELTEAEYIKWCDGIRMTG